VGSALLDSAHRLRKTDTYLPVDRSLNPDWNDRHQAFHTDLVRACGSRRLLELHEQLYQQLERYWSLSVHVDGDRDIVQEYQGLVDAALDRDADRLVDLTVKHLRVTTARIVKAARPRSG
jgi:GntR family carbon starvation induced transcriptional regulator